MFGLLVPMPIRSLPEDESALQQCRAGGIKVLSINVTQAIPISAGPLLVAHPPTPAWVEKNPFVNQLCSLILPSIPAQTLYKAPGILAMLRFPR